MRQEAGTHQLDERAARVDRGVRVVVAGAKTIRYDAEHSTSLSLKFRLAALWFPPRFCRHFNEVFLLLGFRDRKTPTIHVTDHSAFSKPRRAYLAPLALTQHYQPPQGVNINHSQICEYHRIYFFCGIILVCGYVNSKVKDGRHCFCGVGFFDTHPFPDPEDPNTACS
jgi:hypothetical protein